MIWTPDRSIIDPTCRRCGGLRQRWLSEHRRHAGLSMHRMCCCDRQECWRLLRCDQAGSLWVSKEDQDLSAYEGKAVVVNCQCWTVSSAFCPGTGPTHEQVFVEAVFDDCNGCGPEQPEALIVSFDSSGAVMCDCQLDTFGAGRRGVSVSLSGSYALPRIAAGTYQLDVEDSDIGVMHQFTDDQCNNFQCANTATHWRMQIDNLRCAAVGGENVTVFGPVTVSTQSGLACGSGGGFNMRAFRASGNFVYGQTVVASASCGSGGGWPVANGHTAIVEPDDGI